MEQHFVNTVHKKFQRIRKVYKEQRKWKKNGILSLFGIPKPEEKTRSIFDRDFSITDMIKNARKKKRHTKPSTSPNPIELQNI